jgi:hypothetical protein
MSETKTIGSMTERQRNALAAMLGGGEPAGNVVPLPWAGMI